MFPPFNEERAREICQEIFFSLNEKKPLFGSEDFASFSGMFGVLVCADAQGNEVVLKAFGGAVNGRWNIEGWCPPLFDEDAYNKAVQINDKEIHLLTAGPPNETAEEKKARNERRLFLCNQTLSRLYALYNWTCAGGKKCDFKTLSSDISYQGFKSERLFPTGTGDCAAPKLLNQAFSLGLTPLSMAEFFWDGKPSAEKKINFFPPCDEKCGIILPSILGLKILFCDSHIIVVEKPSGLLSVPGRGPEKQDCIVRRVQRLFPKTIGQPSVHRLDMDTSGLMVLAFDEESHRALNAQFEQRQVLKTYVAVLDGLVQKQGGHIELRHRVDIENRPRQIADDIYGKLAVTDWERLRVWTLGGGNGKKGRAVTSVLFTPKTGRTHQLRFASLYGLGHAILGDDIYGSPSSFFCGEKKVRLLLHANYLSFTHPATGKKMEFFSKPPFDY